MGTTSFHDNVEAAQEAGETIENPKLRYPSAAQDWLSSIPVMQQTVLFSGIRGMDGLRKLHPAKALVRFYRRCVLISAFDGHPLSDPFSTGGGDFTGPSVDKVPAGESESGSFFNYYHPGEMNHSPWAQASKLYGVDGIMRVVANDFIRARDEMPLHYFSHMMHAFQIVGTHHPDQEIRNFWREVYFRMVKALHLWPETEGEMNARLGDTEAGWRAREDAAGSCST